MRVITAIHISSVKKYEVRILEQASEQSVNVAFTAIKNI